MEEEDGDASTPFWLQSRRTTSLGSRATNVATQVLFVGVTAILIVFFIIPPFASSVSQIFRPHLVRKSWDFLNFVLVLFAVLCGFLSRNANNDETNHNKEEEISNKFSSSPSIIDRGLVSNGSVTPRSWIDDRGGDDDQTVYKRFSRLRSSSHPDLRLQEFEADERWRFYDDTRVSQCRYEDTDPIYPNQGYRNWQEEVKPPEDVDRTEELSYGEGKVHNGEKVEVVTTAEAEVEEELTVPSNPPPPSAPPYIPSPPLSPPRAPPPRKQAKRKTKRVYQDVSPNEEKKDRSEFVAATPPMTSIPPPTAVYKKSNKQEKKKGGATDFLIALGRKKKKQRQQSIDGLDLLFDSDPPLVYTMPPPPPPPPLPFFQGLFSSKKGKSKRTNSNPPPPPPPPPPERWFETRASMAKIRKAPIESCTSKSNPPAKVTQFIDTGSESPLMPISPPPPPPPPPSSERRFESRASMARIRKAPIESRTSKSNPPAKVTQFIGTGSESPLMPIPPPPPPPPPPERRFESRASIAKIRKAPIESCTSKFNPPAKVTQFIGTGSESPLMPIPPPPPPPPFKMPAWKFVKRGDYVRMASDISISSDEPDDPEVAQSADGKVAGSMFCPSPDVDTKADDFIARFRAGLKLEKMNSVKRRRSNLGPEPGPDESGSS